MYLREDDLPFRAPGEILYSEQEEITENAQRRQMQRDCQDVRVLEWLEKDGPASLREYIAQLEARLSATPRLVEGHKLLAKLKAQGLKKKQFDEALAALLKRYPEMNLFYFPPEYVVQSVEKELAQVRCKLSRARLNFQIWHRSGTPPRDAGFVRLCTPPPRPHGPLIFWTIGAFAPNDEKLNKSQLAEIDLMAKGLAKNPRTRTGMPVLTITGGSAPGENKSAGAGRAIAVRDALVKTLKGIDINLLQFVGFKVAAEEWCAEVNISIRELVPPPTPVPDLRIKPDSPLIQGRPPMAPTGTPLPPAPPPAKSGSRSAQDLFRRRVDSILRKHGVKNAAARKAIADSAVFQTEEALRVAVDQAGISGAQKSAIVESIRALSKGRP